MLAWVQPAKATREGSVYSCSGEWLYVGLSVVLLGARGFDEGKPKVEGGELTVRPPL